MLRILIGLVTSLILFSGLGLANASRGVSGTNLCQLKAEEYRAQFKLAYDLYLLPRVHRIRETELALEVIPNSLDSAENLLLDIDIGGIKKIVENSKQLTLAISQSLVGKGGEKKAAIEHIPTLRRQLQYPYLEDFNYEYLKSLRDHHTSYTNVLWSSDEDGNMVDFVRGGSLSQYSRIVRSVQEPEVSYNEDTGQVVIEAGICSFSGDSSGSTVGREGSTPKGDSYGSRVLGCVKVDLVKRKVIERVDYFNLERALEKFNKKLVSDFELNKRIASPKEYFHFFLNMDRSSGSKKHRLMSQGGIKLLKKIPETCFKEDLLVKNLRGYKPGKKTYELVIDGEGTKSIKIGSPILSTPYTGYTPESRWAIIKRFDPPQSNGFMRRCKYGPTCKRRRSWGRTRWAPGHRMRRFPVK